MYYGDQNATKLSPPGVCNVYVKYKLEPDGTEVELASTLLKLLNCFACFNQKMKS